MTTMFSTKEKQYKKLSQNDIDSDISPSEDEKEIFRQPGNIELHLYPVTGGTKKREDSGCKKFSIIVSLLVVLASVLTVAVIYLKQPTVKGKVERPVVPLKAQTPGWDLTLNDTGGEGGVDFVDVDGDGVRDIILGTIDALRLGEVMMANETTFSDFHKFCKEKGLEYPCVGSINALRGYDGKKLWEIKIRSEVFLINCQTFDINKDGKLDCLATGRQGIVVAFDPFLGKELWSCEDDRFIKANWNTYGAVPLPDWDRDGVPEILVPNGGDPARDAKDHNRESGRLIILSGATGQPLGDRFLPMPDSKETYMSLVLYTPPEGATSYVLFGSGGETVPGDLMGITVADLCLFMFGDKKEVVCPSPEEKHLWSFKETDENGIFIIYEGKIKGVMVPPVLVDMNDDGYNDLVCSLYDGAVILYNGKTLEPMWTAQFPNMESYSSPAPGYFNDDGYLDFMVHWCVGKWMDYSGSNTTVISGKDGSILWTQDSAKMMMTSDFTIMTTQDHKDMFLYRVQGRDSIFRWDLEGTMTRNNTVVHRRKRHGGEEEKEQDERIHQAAEIMTNTSGGNLSIEEAIHEMFVSHMFSCEDDVTSYRGEVFIINRDMVTDPVRVMNIPSTKYHINVPPEADDQDDAKDGKICRVLEPDKRTNTGISDLDGDGTLDYLSVLIYSIPAYNGNLGNTYRTVIRKINLETDYIEGTLKTVQVTAETSLSSESKGRQSTEGTGKVFLPIDQQFWTGYMGRFGNNFFPKKSSKNQ